MEMSSVNGDQRPNTRRERGRLRPDFSAAGLLLTAALLTGCGGGDNGPEYAEHLVTASGTVTSAGAPLPGATVTFHPSGAGGVTASGVTDAEGRYRLYTAVPGASADDTLGAVVGDYKVTVSRILMPDGSPVPAGTTPADAMAEDATESLPPRYSDPETTELTMSVPEAGSDSLDLKLPM